MSSLSSDEVIVRTSKFEQRSSQVLDSIKELHCIDSNSETNSNPDLSLPHMTTGNDLLNAYSNISNFHDSLSPIRRTGSSLRRVESMPVQKMRTAPHDMLIDLDGKYAKEYFIENPAMEHILKHPCLDASSEECSTSQTNIGLSRQKRPTSYKLAIKLKRHETEEINI